MRTARHTSPEEGCRMEEREQEALRELGAARVGEIHCITIIGQVEGHVMLPPDTKTTKYEH